MTNVAVLGLGAMGSGMAKNLIDAGHDVVVYNRTAERAAPLREAGAAVAGSPRDAARQADAVIAMVTDDEASRAVWLDADTGALGGLRDGAVVLESSTLTPSWIKELGDTVAAAGGAFLDTPVVGSRPHVAAGQLVYLVGGDAAVLERVRDILTPNAGAIHHVGPVGAGAVMKLVVNTLFGVQAAVFGEMLGFLARAEIDQATSIEILNTLPVTSPAAQRLAGLMAEREFAPNFPIGLVAKDFGYMVGTADSLGAKTPIAATARDIFVQAGTEGFGGDDIAGVAQLFRE